MKDPTTSLAALLKGASVLVTCGAGGVGKTTVAAALGVAAVRSGRSRVLVVTVDPARRLATALGLEDGIGNEPRLVAASVLAAAGIEVPGELWVAMVDMKQSWDDLVRRHAPDDKTALAILANPLYRNLTGSFTQSHDYIAAERLHELTTAGFFDLIVVDTPPSRSALDFLDAPSRMADFFASRLLRWLIAPYRNRFVNLASKPFTAVADRLLGAEFLSDIAEFFILFQSMYDGFVARAQAVERTMAAESTRFVLVTTLDALPCREARAFASDLRRRRLPLAALVMNRVLPESMRSAEGLEAAKQILADPIAAASRSAGDRQAVASVLARLGQSYLDYHDLAVREQALAATLAELAPEVLTALRLGSGVSDLGAVVALALQLQGERR